MVTLSHYSAKPFVLDRNRSYKLKPDYTMKPSGLWLSDDSDFGWKAWSESAAYNLEELSCKTDFEIDLSDVLVLDSDKKILDFTECYQMPILGFETLKDIQWDRFKETYKGILISPYSWDLRSDNRTFWYYGWDCSSACIWDLSAIA